MQASVAMQRSMEHQSEALKLLKKVHSQQMTNDRSCVSTPGGDRYARGKDPHCAAAADARFPCDVDIDPCGTSSLNGRFAAAPGAGKRPTARTIAERARGSVLARLIDIASHTLSVEADLCRCTSYDQRILLRPKDSIELRNICTRMSRGEAGVQSEPDLLELRDCLRSIVHGLMSSFRDCDNHPAPRATERLREIYMAFPDIG